MHETSKSMHSKHEFAESIAISALGFLASDTDRLEQFLTLSGLTPDQVRVAASDPNFLAGVLQHLLSDEKLAAGFAQEAGLKAEELAAAAHLLATG